MARQTGEVRRRQIADAALRILSRDGPRKFTTRQLSRALNLAEGTIFRHFPDKSAIVAAAVARLDERLFADFPPVHSDPLERLGIFFRQRVVLIQQDPELVRLLFSEDLARAGGDHTTAALHTVRDRSARFVLGCLQEAADAGMTREGISAPELFAVVYGTVLGMLLGPRSGLHQALPVHDPDRAWAVIARLIQR